MPNDHEYDVKKVEAHHGGALPQVQMTVCQEHHAEARCHNEEADVPDKTLARHFEGSDQGHRACNDGGDKAGGTDQLPNCQTSAMSLHCGKSGEDIWTAISKREKCHSCHTLAHAQDAGDSAEIDAEEVAGGNADCAEEQAQPYDQYDEGKRLGLFQLAIVQLEVGKYAGFLVRTIHAHKSALIFGGVNEMALSGLC